MINDKSVSIGSSPHCIVACAHLGNGTGHRTATLVAPLLLSSGLVRYDTILGLVEWGGEYRLVTVCTLGDFIVLPQWNTSGTLSHSDLLS